MVMMSKTKLVLYDIGIVLRKTNVSHIVQTLMNLFCKGSCKSTDRSHEGISMICAMLITQSSLLVCFPFLIVDLS